MRRWMRWVAAVGVALAVTGCSAPTGAPVPGGEAGATVVHAQGTTTVPAQPRRIVALSGEEDTLAVLGIAPVAYGEAFRSPGRRAPWLEGWTALDTATVLPDTQTAVDIEEIAGLRPDLILATNLYSIDEYYEQLSRVAPTVAAPVGREVGTSSWQDLSLHVGRAVGQEAQAREGIRGVQERVAAFRDRLPGLRGKTFTTSFHFAPGSVVTVNSTDTGANALFTELGMQLAPGVQQGSGTRVSVSFEQLGRLDADFVALGFANDDLRRSLIGNPLFRNLDASRRGHVAEMSTQAAAASNNPTILNTTWQLENFRPVLERVAAG